ncbi:alpha/beta hydrolase [Erwiniaceae bacterium BAC15a-03b]|uniref:Alpha/beta hydrolase n=1 Tax=Winslowiella arboricola TaxID=2978220 RepID=A0A9J6PVN3_9GAMM|nr:alpha/beta hydrolase [Winslowiella arboricola]MCU5774329.1 alpha/beta hydrolase [Winslowiella arboricola]MCU5778876.1 alpha/beta hydrolase [Winslowiella arboricola]
MIEFLLVPGLRDSDPAHWQSAWQQQYPHWKRITQRNWSQPDLDGWCDAISRQLPPPCPPALLMGHSFGALAALSWARLYPERVAGLVLVAPAEPLRFLVEDRILPQPLPCPSLLFASHNDPLLPFGRASFWAEAWGSTLLDIGEAGHINSEAGFGPWPWGLAQVIAFAASLTPMTLD